MVQSSPKYVLAGILSLALLAAVAAGPTPAQAARPSLERLQAALSLTDDQARAIHQLHASRWEARYQLRKSLREARRSLRDLVLTGADDAAVQAKTAEVQQLVAQGVQMRVEGLRAMSQILTPEQRDKLRQRRPTWH